MADIVIGSGPSGVSAAKALLARGRSVVMLDGGKTLEDQAEAAKSEFAEIGPDAWSPDQRAAYQAPQFATPAGQARRFGSDFAMEPAASTLAPDQDWLGLRASHAVGGLSNLWGSAILPNRQSDISDWPITIDDLSPHYARVADFMPVSAKSDDLAELFPGFSVADRTSIPPSPQAAALIKRLDRSKRSLPASFHYGASRVAVSAACKRCAMCLHGCPWNLIYSASHTLDTMRGQTGFEYRPGTFIESFEETTDGVFLGTHTGDTLKADRVFVATGVLETARLVLRSLPSLGALTLKDSQHGFVPMLHRWFAPARPDALPTTTLPQAFVEIDDPEVSPHLVHSQIYTWNEHYLRDLMENYGHKIPGSAPLWRILSRRLIVAQMFLHSDHSAQIGLRLNRDGKLDAELKENADTAKVFERAKKTLSPAMSKAGLTTLGFATRMGAAGSSFHTGGSLAMAKQPVARQSDVLGRPYGLNRVHIVDASVLPSIPATTITFSVMANAHRIASLAP